MNSIFISSAFFKIDFFDVTLLMNLSSLTSDSIAQKFINLYSIFTEVCKFVGNSKYKQHIY